MVGTIDAVSSNNVSVTPSTRTKNKNHVNEDGEEWKNSKQKKDIAAFLDDESGIHIMSPAQIFDTYADGVGWERQNAVANIRRLKKQYTNKEGPFSEKKTNEGETLETSRQRQHKVRHTHCC